MSPLKSSPCVILLSGGLDSAVTAAIAKKKGFDLYALTLKYGQRHAMELMAAKRVARAMEIESHTMMPVDLARFGGSSLTGDIPVPKSQPIPREKKFKPFIPSTYVPARNTVFLSLALAYAETLGAYHIFIGANSIDYSGYPDCRPEYLRAFERMANLATRAGVEKRGKYKIHAPLLKITKAEIIKKGQSLGVDFALTHSCYDPKKTQSCGRCDSCRLRSRGFKEAGFKDPAEKKRRKTA